MKYITAIIALLAFAVLVTPVLAVPPPASGDVPAGASPGDTTPDICVDTRMVGIMSREGGTINDCSYRVGQYAFEGETISYTVMIRDPNGVPDIGNLYVMINDVEKVLCEPITSRESCDGLGNFDRTTDKWFTCTYTVEPTATNYDAEVSLQVYNGVGVPTESSFDENFVFNPGLSLDVDTDDQLPIAFEPGLPGECVHSTNKIVVTNNADNGVNLWVYIASTDLTASSGVGHCPTTNQIDVTVNMFLRARSGTAQSPWLSMFKYDETDGCDYVCGGPPRPTCYGGKPIVLPPSTDNKLTNGASLEVELKLCYPVPCIGTFDQGTIYVYGMAI